MQSSNIPSKIPLPFGYAAGSGYINPIPTNSQIGIVNGRASLHDGFPPDTFIPIASGGVPPFGSDVNGILNEITAIQQWQQAGGFFPFDSAFSTIIGGYPKGAIIQSSAFNGLWLSTIENNTNNPDTNGTGWISLSFEGVQPITMSGTSVTLTSIQAAYPIIVLTGTLTSACNLILPAQAGEWIIQNNTTGAYTVQAKTASGTGVNIVQGYSTYVYGDGTNIYFANSAQVASFNGRTGAVTLNATDVTSALGYVPANQGLGFNGTYWHDVTGSRGFYVTYTNSRTYPIVVNVGTYVGLSVNYGWNAVVGGVEVIGIQGYSGNGSAKDSSGSFIVPPGSNYAVNLTYPGSLSFWAELY